MHHRDHQKHRANLTERKAQAHPSESSKPQTRSERRTTREEENRNSFRRRLLPALKSSSSNESRNTSDGETSHSSPTRDDSLIYHQLETRDAMETLTRPHDHTTERLKDKTGRKQKRKCPLQRRSESLDMLKQNTIWIYFCEEMRENGEARVSPRARDPI